MSQYRKRENDRPAIVFATMSTTVSWQTGGATVGPGTEPNHCPL